ncbi:CGNR zinc finger domain-containing protein [Streptomyces sp. DSM 40750]|uniref:CGNR zinc finger domain-containing protein n=1 Tax=Streptomyces sp. DSM 40750 TaxID=2801030 RepID=UPI00214AF69B|nr:CGNR zinc finger domain-containing protein [Streptomyces sp. DSM 40750]UUU25918.1 CGNR zinc finger domain-containing protein [Streptomyces sp. DSM 40750]
MGQRPTPPTDQRPTPPLPPDAALLHAFVNTLDLRSFVRHGTTHQGGDQLSSPQALADWLRTRELVDPGTPADRRDLDRAHRLRADLRACLAPAPATVSSADDAPSAGEPPAVRLDIRLSTAPGRPPALLPGTDGADGALTVIALAAVRAAQDGSLARLKVCQAPDCRWVFYDHSRPGLARWCAPELCGNRMKTRAYRQRRH